MSLNAMHQDVNSKSKGCLLKKMEIETDSDVPEFSLPPKSIVKRPKKVIRKRTRSIGRKYCKKCCRYCSGILLTLVLCACVLSIALLFWFSLRLYRDVESLSRKLTIEVNRVKTEQVSNVEKCTSLELQMKANMKVLENGQKDILDFKKQLQMSYAKIAILNGTLLKVSELLHSPGSKMSLGSAVNALKKGMAVTGAEMTKLSDEIKQIGEATSLQASAIKRIIVGLFNISYSLANVTRNSQAIFHLNAEDYLQKIFHGKNLPSVSEENTNGSVLRPTDMYDLIHRLNSSLSAQMKHLQSEAQILMNTVGNISQSSSSENVNNDQIQLLWEAIESQNQSIIQIQEIMKQSIQQMSGIADKGIPSRRDTETRKDSSMEDNFELFPGDTDTLPSKPKQDTWRKLKSNSEKKYRHKLGDFGDDNNTL